jgi:hypothetical protein
MFHHETAFSGRLQRARVCTGPKAIPYLNPNAVITALCSLMLCVVSPSLSSAVEKQYDLVVYGATPGGVACAVRAAREGLSVQLVSHAEHLGGMLSNGLSTMDTLYNGRRAPLYDELREKIYAHYLQKYGVLSPQYQATQPGHPKTRYEAHVVENLINELLNAESRILVVKRYYPVAVTSESALLRSVTFRKVGGKKTLTVHADAFADCSYEADLAAVAGVLYRVGREARDEFQEKHAGVIYVRRQEWPPTNVETKAWAIARDLNLFRYSEWFDVITEASTGKANPAVQGYNIRTIITSNPTNRIPIKKPKHYDPESLRKFGMGDPADPGLSMPNQKFGMNEPKLVGKQDPYVEGDWKTRNSVTEQHRQATLALLYFRQHDPSVPLSIRQQWLQYGLPKDEFADNGHMPHEIYARETRRIHGLSVFSENDAQLASGLERAPIRSDSISITEWFLDSHACTPSQVPGSEMEGKVMLKNQTFPGQVSYRTIIPKGFKNFIVPVCLSSTHIGWGTIRLEPTWMSISEAAAYAVVKAKREELTVAEIETDGLLRLLAERRFMLSFFNDVEGQEDADWFPAVQYLGTKGFFGTYDAQPLALLTTPLATAWIEHATRLMQNQVQDATSATQRILTAERKSGAPAIARDFADLLTQALPIPQQKANAIHKLLARSNIDPEQPITRGNASHLIFQVLASK